MSSPLSLSGLDMPRRNGDLAFDAPWQSTVFALAAAVVENAFGGDREPFRQQLIAAIAADPRRPYWESWTAALEELVQTLPGAGQEVPEPITRTSLVSSEEQDERTEHQNRQGRREQDDVSGRLHRRPR